MILRHAREPVDGQPVENTFVAVDERSGAALGSCTIFIRENEVLFPNRPLRIYLEIAGEPAPDALLGASVARAMEIGLQSRRACRVFTQVEPDNAERMTALAALGFRDNDGLVCMQRDLSPCSEIELPYGCVVVRDTLDDPIEQKFFLERYNQLYNECFDFEWLQDYRSKPGFGRILLVGSGGMVCECVIWQEGRSGVIGWIQTSKKWRRRGIAQAMLHLACDEFEARGLQAARSEIQARVPYVLKCFERSGFVQSQLVARYPGIDIDPQ